MIRKKTSQPKHLTRALSRLVLLGLLAFNSDLRSTLYTLKIFLIVIFDNFTTYHTVIKNNVHVGSRVEFFLDKHYPPYK